MLNGIDISHYQTTTPDLTNEDFVFVKVTDGLNKDPLYDMHVSNVLKAGKVLGDYAFGYDLSPTFSAEQQAAAFLLFATTELLALDVENSKLPMTNSQGAAFIAYVHSKGHKIGLYHSDNAFPDLGQDWNWPANWNSKPTRPWTFWQSQGSPLDLDVFNGDMTALLALAGKDATLPTMGLKFDIVKEESGTLTVNQDGSWAVLTDGSGHVVFNKGDTKHYMARIRLAANYGTTPNTQDGFLVGTTAAVMFARNVTPTPNVPIDTTALEKAAFNNAIGMVTTEVKKLTIP